MTTRAAFFISVAAVLYSACTGESGTTEPTVEPQEDRAVVEVILGSTDVVVGDSARLTAEARNAAGQPVAGIAFAWSSSSDATASVSQEGVVTGRLEGVATITAAADGRTGRAEVRVRPVPVSSVTIEPDTLQLQVGQIRQLTPTVKDAKGNVLLLRPVLWASPDSTVVRVASSGIVTATGGGRTTVVATSEGASDSVAVVVTDPPAGVGSGTVAFDSDRDRTDRRREIYAVDSGGGAAVRLTSSGLGDAASPYFSPDGTQLVFIATESANADVHLMNSDGSGLRALSSTTLQERHPSWSPDGRLVSIGYDYAITSVHPDGSNLRMVISGFTEHEYGRVTWSPDGTRIAFHSKLGLPRTAPEVFTASADGTNIQQLTHLGHATFPAWSPDGKTIAFTARVGGMTDLYLMNADGTGVRRLGPNDPNLDIAPAWSPDGKQIAFARYVGNMEIFVINVDGSGLRNLTQHPAADQNPTWR